jgi:hypothetical protein
MSSDYDPWRDRPRMSPFFKGYFLGFFVAAAPLMWAIIMLMRRAP